MVIELQKRIQVIYSGRVRFDLEIKGRVTVIGGDSSTGKTFLVTALREAAAAAEVATESEEASNFKRYTMIDYSTKMVDEIIMSSNNSIIVIDNADTVLRGKKELIEHINYDINNQYIVMSRGGVSLRATPNYRPEMRREADGVYRLNYKFSIPGWF